MGDPVMATGHFPVSRSCYCRVFCLMVALALIQSGDNFRYGDLGVVVSGGGVASALGASVLCSLIPGLTYKQRSLCRSAPDAVAAVGVGARLGRNECAAQFGHRRWNCTPIGSDTVFGHVVVVGSREAAFTYAITSAGVAYAVTQACSRGNISGCGCAWGVSSNSNTAGGWKWGGCSADVGYGMRFARKFVDAREIEGDSRSLMNLHNNKAGRKAVRATLLTECKCHGVSGSCTLKTCWRTLPPFRVVGDYLMKKYSRARPVAAVQTIVPPQRTEGGRTDAAESGGSSGSSGGAQRHSRKAGSAGPRIKLVLKTIPTPRMGRRSDRHDDVMVRAARRGLHRGRPPKGSELVYLQKSPNYCEKDVSKGSLGTAGRKCNRTSKGTDGCDLLCCGRGYNTHQLTRVWQCRCKFHWCCHVRCATCSEKVEEYTCK
ncbi:protein Wnt-7b [Ischnura elegans]|uniref:protein Wnt-7b n=1 Tax=Ischnura elegans TaxID=197161 RepID=UPI001ED8AE63|nr:protein Wnt-7b [Ischnura elegans]